MKRIFFLFVLLFGSLNAMFSSSPEGIPEGFRKVHVLPTVDIAFKKVFGEEKNKPVLIHFLNSILNRAVNPIVDLKFANTEIPPETLSDKLSRLDVLVQTSKKETINIEIQVKDAGNMVDRSMYYASRLIANSLSSGQSYDKLPRFIMINLLGYNAFADERSHRIITLSDTVTHVRYTDMLELHFLELQKYKPSISNLEEAWVLFLKDPNSDLLLKPETPKEFATAREILLMLEGDKEFTAQYIQREKDVRDQISAISTAEMKVRIDTAKKMMLASIPTEQIMTFTGLTAEQIDSLQK